MLVHSRCKCLPSYLVLLISGASLTACQARHPAPTTPPPKVAAGKLRRLAGTWVQHDSSGFQIVRIKPDSTGTYTRFLDYAPVVGHAFFRQHPEAPHYAFTESPLKVRYRPHPAAVRGMAAEGYVQIWTSRFRFDYYLVGDTLREYDKMGFQGSLVRVQRGD